MDGTSGIITRILEQGAWVRMPMSLCEMSAIAEYRHKQIHELMCMNADPRLAMLLQKVCEASQYLRTYCLNSELSGLPHPLL